MHRLFLLAGLLLLGMGTYGLYNFFHLKGPSIAEMHELKLMAVTNVFAESEIPGSERIDSIWLTTSNGTKIRYRERFPYSTEVMQLNPAFVLLLDTSNRIWAVKNNGEILAHSYFEEYNIEALSS